MQKNIFIFNVNIRRKILFNNFLNSKCFKIYNFIISIKFYLINPKEQRFKFAIYVKKFL